MVNYSILRYMNLRILIFLSVPKYFLNSCESPSRWPMMNDFVEYIFPSEEGMSNYPRSFYFDFYKGCDILTLGILIHFRTIQFRKFVYNIYHLKAWKINHAALHKGRTYKNRAIINFVIFLIMIIFQVTPPIQNLITKFDEFGQLINVKKPVHDHSVGSN